MSHPLAGKTSATLAVMLSLLAAPYFSRHLARFRIVQAPWDRSAVSATPAFVPASVPKLTQGEATLRASTNEATITNALPTAPVATGLDPQALAKTRGSIAVEDATGHALDSFYATLARTRGREPGAITRILHYGDSVITSDYVSGTMRRRFQAEFGDAGHGFILVANPWEWYFHNDVSP